MRIIRWIPVLIWVCVICFLSFSSLEELPVPSFFSADKVAHFSMYFILEFMLLYALNKKSTYLFLATFLAVLFSGFTEIVQHYWVENRYGEWMDFIANLTGLLAAYLWLIRRKKT